MLKPCRQRITPPDMLWLRLGMGRPCPTHQLVAGGSGGPQRPSVCRKMNSVLIFRHTFGVGTAGYRLLAAGAPARGCPRPGCGQTCLLSPGPVATNVVRCKFGRDLVCPLGTPRSRDRMGPNQACIMSQCSIHQPCPALSSRRLCRHPFRWVQLVRLAAVDVCWPPLGHILPARLG